MTPQEAQLINDLFNRLANLESAPRDTEAERIIASGLARAPHAVYALVQTALVQDEALRRADARIRELTGEDQEPSQQHGSFLDSMRTAFSGRPARGSVPSVPPAAEREEPRYRGASAMPGPAPGGSFLGTAAASAAGAIGGGLLLNSISSMFGRQGGSAFAAVPNSPAASPLDKSASDSTLAREAGAGDIGQSGRDEDRTAGLFDDADESEPPEDRFSEDDFDPGDFGGDDSTEI
jgi:hypothetical protein